MLDSASIERILSTIPKKTIGLVGDLFLDRYLDIDAGLTEPSLETGLDAYQITGVRSYPGALGTVINNLAALGVGRIVPIAFIGDDGEGYELQQALKKLPGVVSDRVFSIPERRTPTYTKPMLCVAGEVPRELNRLDIKNRKTTPLDVRQRVIDHLLTAWAELDAIIVLDQVSELNCGVITGDVREFLIAQSKRDCVKFVLADSRERISDFVEMAIKPNARESLGLAGSDQQAALEKYPAVFRTDAENGIRLWQRTKKTEATIPGYPVSGPIDPVGAGDSCSAGIACAMASGENLETAAAFGNLIASITVQQIGTTGTASPAQVRARWQQIEGRQ